MRMYDIILKKRDGNALSDEEIKFAVNAYTAGEVPDYQISALLMAIFFAGLDRRETAALTLAMARSGDTVDLSAVVGFKVDKHSTGGVGDKTTLICAPIVAACGLKVAKLSGRGLGHTGGTIDKLEAFPGLKTNLPAGEFIDIVNKIGIAVIGQTGDIAPADKKLYALRDVTATVDNISLIAASIMSKKLAVGSDAILLDVKTGSGAFMKTLEDSIKLAQLMVDIGESNGRRTAALVTNMDAPLGVTIGNALELVEVIETLSGKGSADLTQVSLTLAADMLFLGGKGDKSECEKLAKQALSNGSALKKLREMVVAQGGDGRYVDDVGNFTAAKISRPVLAKESGYIYHINAEKCGIASAILGAGRSKKEDAIDYSAGILLKKSIGDYVAAGEEIAQIFTSTMKRANDAQALLDANIEIRAEKPPAQKLILARVTSAQIERF